MSDFDDVVYVETDDKPVGAGVAPSGDYTAKVIAAEKYKSQQGNWKAIGNRLKYIKNEKKEPV